MQEEDIVTILLESLLDLYKYLIIAMKMMPMKELMMEYVTTRLMHEMSKCKEKEPRTKCGDGIASKQNERSTFVTRHKDVFLLWQTGPHYTIFLQIKEQGEEECKKCKGQRQICICNATHSTFDERLQWIMNSGATKHMTSYKVTFDTYKVISSCNVHLSGERVVEVIRMESTIMRIETKGKTNRICIVNMLHVPKLQLNLLSVNKLLSKGLKV